MGGRRVWRKWSLVANPLQASGDEGTAPWLTNVDAEFVYPGIEFQTAVAIVRMLLNLYLIAGVGGNQDKPLRQREAGELLVGQVIYVFVHDVLRPQ